MSAIDINYEELTETEEMCSPLEIEKRTLNVIWDDDKIEKVSVIVTGYC